MDYHAFTRKCDGMCDICDCDESVRLPHGQPRTACMECGAPRDVRPQDACAACGSFAWVVRRETPNVQGAAQPAAEPE